MKKFYAFVTLALASFSMVQAQGVIEDTDVDVYAPWDWQEYSDPSGLTLINSNMTMKHFALNVCGLPKSYSTSGQWQPITLNGSSVRFYDEPQYAYPSAENFIYPEEIDGYAEEGIGWDWENDAALYFSTSINNDWVIEGKGNAIYLDSYCNFSGTVTGGSAGNPVELTIYCTNRSQITTAFRNVKNEANPTFVGTVYFKSLDGYECDSIVIGGGFQLGYDGGTGAFAHHSTYAGSDLVLDVTGMNSPVVYFNYNNPVVPPVIGSGEIRTGYYSEYIGYNGLTWPDKNEWVCDSKITMNSEDTTHSMEHYGGSITYNKQVDVYCNYAYVRSGANIYFNDPEPSLSHATNDFSQREDGTTGGTGFLDAGYSPNNHKYNRLSPGYPYNEVNTTFKVRNVWMSGTNNGLHIDFDNEGHSDVLNVTETYRMFPGQSQLTLGLPAQFSPKAGKYKVINGNIDAGYSTYNDTIGYEVWDNNGCAYIVRSVKGGEKVIAKPGYRGIYEGGEEFIAEPGDSIGSASFGNLASTYGATCMDGNRPHYVIKTWGAGSYTNGEFTDGDYKNTEDPKFYVPNSEQIGTAFSDPDSTKWLAAWEEFVAAHPVSDAWEKVELDDASIIEGTMTDSIFVTYSRYHSESGEGGIAGGHAWSWKNGSGYLCSDHGYPYASAITYAYFYYSNNSLRLYGEQKAQYVAGENDTTFVSFPQQTYPIVLTQNRDSVNIRTESDTVDIWQFKTDTLGYRWYTAWSAKVPQANGDSVSYRFNFKNFITDGIIAIETATYKKGEEKPVYETPGEDDSEDIINADDLAIMGTFVKEAHAVANKTIYTLDGLKVNQYTRGINIVKFDYTDGTTETKRVIIR